jgi:arylsulfatase A-like enzyme
VVQTPHLDALSRESVNFVNAVSGWPVCSPYRATLLTGRHPHSHGVFINDVPLNNDATSFAQALTAAGYDTGYIGKWHIDGHGRSSFIPRERRQGFDYWKVLECTHNYNESYYYGDDDVKRKWEGYDVIAQTRDAQRYIRDHADSDKPFALFVSWGPPHNPYQTAPEKYRAMYPKESVDLRSNVPAEMADKAREDIAGYYAHCTALDDCTGDLLGTLDELGIAEDTIFVYTSDHGDMLGSQGQERKQKPWDESIRVPFLLRYPKALGTPGQVMTFPINSPDIMPTMLSMCGVDIPKTVEGRDYSQRILENDDSGEVAALLACHSPFGEWIRKRGGREFRGVRTKRYTYTRTLDGPWLLYDNERDPEQLDNLCNKPEHADLQAHLETLLQRELEHANDEFLPGPEYIKQWNYAVDENGTMPYKA